ncbi:MAG: choice-of-anchor Q domain-containing protein [Bacteroidota bacterium]
MKKLLLLFFALAFFYIANSAVPVVTNNNDAGAGSLRQAILNANANPGFDFIDFDISVTGVIILTTGELAITDEVTIVGRGAKVLSVLGANTSRVFHISGGATVTISNLTISDGSTTGNGGGILVEGSVLNLNNSAVSNNSANAGAGICILPANSIGSATITGCTIAFNDANSGGGGTGGGIYVGSDMTSCGTLVVINSTISRNYAASGAGISTFCSGAGSTTLTNTTLCENWGNAGQGGGIYNRATVTLINSIVAKSIGGGDIVNLVGTTNAQYSLVGDGSGINGTSSNNIAGNPQLGLLAYNGGPTMTNALLAGSPAIDKGKAVAGIITDQRGNARPFDNLSVSNAPGGNGSDIGAFEDNPCTVFTNNRAYVSAGASGANNGATWANAFTSLQSALSAAGTCSISEIWVAAGTYIPTTSTDANISFVLKNNLRIYGGFNGTETLLTERDWFSNNSILNGDIPGGNSYAVVRANTGTNTTAILDGFTITGGHATSGGGLIPGSRGGGMCILNSASPTVSNCIFSNNIGEYGAGVYKGASSSPVFTSCTFQSNTSQTGGGAVYCEAGGSPSFSDCFFLSNTAGQYGGALYANGANVNFANCRFGSNHASFGGAIFTTAGAGQTANHTLVNCDFSMNSANNLGGAIVHGFGGVATAGSGLFDCTNCKFTNNSATNYDFTSGSGGAFYNGATGFNGRFTNCIFNNNAADGSGSDDGGGAIMVYKGTVDAINSTFANNHAFKNGGAITIYFSNGTLHVKNSIFWDNAAQVNGPSIYTGNGPAVATLEYSLLQDASCPANVTCGAGNIYSTDPLFVNLANSDFHLQTCSPAVNAGNDAANATTTDFDGLTRKVGIIDMGAYELQQPASQLLIAAEKRIVTRNIGFKSMLAFTQDCRLITGLKSEGAEPVFGNVTATVWIEPVQPTYNGRPYLRRHYEITATSNAANATGTITLYFTQQEFNDFNAVPGHGPDLPANKDDLSDILNFAIYKYSGTSNNGTGLPGTYPQPGVLLTAPAVNLVWNNAKQWWEATFATKGFSGFFAGNIGYTILPIGDLLNFNVVKQGGGAALNWQVNAGHNFNMFTVEKSYNGRDFTPMQSMSGKKDITNYNAIDPTLQNGLQYYRLKLSEKDGSIGYSAVKTLMVNRSLVITMAPNPTKGRFTIDLKVEGQSNAMAQIQLQDVAGKILYTQQAKLNAGMLNQSVNMPASAASGVYLVRILIDGKTYHAKLMYEK